MQRKGANISLKGYDDIFSTEQSRAESQQERVQEIPLSELHPFEGHPFRVVDGITFSELVCPAVHIAAGFSLYLSGA